MLCFPASYWGECPTRAKEAGRTRDGINLNHPMLLSKAFAGFLLLLLQVQVPLTPVGRSRSGLAPLVRHVCPTIWHPRDIE